MKLSVCVLFLGCLVLAAAIPAPREEGLQALRDKLEDLVAGIEALQEAAMEKREQAEEDLLAEDEDLEAEAEEPQEAEMDKRAFNREVYEICEGTCDSRHPLSYSDYNKCEKRCDKLARSSALKTFKVKVRAYSHLPPDRAAGPRLVLGGGRRTGHPTACRFAPVLGLPMLVFQGGVSK
ncbi:Hypp5037 [Branchiostoma lanceolatum]|uniref:Hypp5037 protein n=1 Tax=Branchiostoma lanceolatum TaxID=7740 RepID=A0A8K0F2X6_BRALA|nr:Hypp5037 [Branchiostoma lanceolatum]